MPAEESKGVAGFLALSFDVGQLGFGGGDFGLSTSEVDFIDDAGFEFFVEQFLPLLPQRNGAAEGVEFRIGGTQKKILRGDIARERQQRMVVAGGGGIGSGAGGFDLTADLAPEVDLVAEIEQRVEAVDASTRDGHGHGCGQIAGGLFAFGVALQTDVRCPAGGADACACSCLGDACGSGLERGAGLNGEGFEA